MRKVAERCQYFRPNGFGPSWNSPEISQTYVDGVSITHGSPWQHVWTLATAHREAESDISCPYLSPTFNGVIPALLLMTTTVKLAAGQHLNNVTILMILSGMVRGVRGRMSALTEEDRNSASSCLNQLRMTLRWGCALANSVDGSHEDVVLEQIELYVQ